MLLAASSSISAIPQRSAFLLMVNIFIILWSFVNYFLKVVQILPVIFLKER